MAGTVDAASAASSASSQSPPLQWRPSMGPPYHPCCVRAATGRAGWPPSRAPAPPRRTPWAAAPGGRCFVARPAEPCTQRRGLRRGQVLCPVRFGVVGLLQSWEHAVSAASAGVCSCRRCVGLWQACFNLAWVWKPGVPPLRLPAQAYNRAGPGRCGMGVGAHWTSPGMHGRQCVVEPGELPLEPPRCALGCV